ncbi:MAG: hypothetical protein HRU04_10355 [Oceanospirillaceae bacterium]|nr:hypothetical protein [Oceanospirillaceae bacterium]
MYLSNFSLKALAIFTIIFLSSAVQSKEKKVLIIESYHQEFHWDANYSKGIKSILEGRASLYFFEMDTKRLSISEHQKRAEEAIARIDDLQPDIVMLGDDNALRLVGKAVLSREIPLVFLGINGNPRDYFDGIVPFGISGVLERPLLKRDLLLVKKINPEWKNILVLFDNSPTAKIYRDSPFFFAGNNHIEMLGLNIEIFLSNSYEEIQTKVKQAQIDKDVLFIGGLNALKDKRNQHIDSRTVIKWIYRQSEVPMFGFWKGTAGRDAAIGGYVIDGFSMGTQAARQVITILEGDSSLNRKIEWQKHGRLILSQSGLKRWNIVIPNYLQEEAEYID